MKFLSNENFPGPSVDLLVERNIDMQSIAKESPGISDKQVIDWAIKENRTILTHDSDYGELIFKHGYSPPAGVIYFRIYDFKPEDPAMILFDIIDQEVDLSGKLTVINDSSIRQRTYK